MLKYLQIENIAVIEKSEIQFEAGLNVLTGETGAGKSILIDSINIILGNRAAKELIRTGCSKAVIRAVFDNIPAETSAQLEKYGLPVEEELLLVRELFATGKNTCRVNGLPVTVAALRDICSGLISINGQHDSLGLLNPANHLKLTDAFAQNQDIYRDYYACYKQLIAVKKELDTLLKTQKEKEQRIDLLQFQIDEIDSACLQPDEETKLENRSRVLQNLSAIQQALTLCHDSLSGGDETSGGLDYVQSALEQLKKAAAHDKALAQTVSQLSDCYFALKDVAQTIAETREQYDSDEQELSAVEDRLERIRGLKKYGGTIEEILAYSARAKQELAQIDSDKSRIETLRAMQSQLIQSAKQKAQILTDSRLKAFDALNGRIAGTLQYLNMPGVRFTLQHSVGPIASRGRDEMEFYISTNPGEEAKPLSKVASGGELSRILLALASALSDKDAVPTVIYDEIDSGVSGIAAGRIGDTLKESAKSHQILCVTHTAQIAALADCQFEIRKTVEGDRTYTKVYKLEEEQRVREIARLFAGGNLTELNLANAREMMEKGRAAR